MSVINKDEIRKKYRRIRKEIIETKRVEYSDLIFNYFINSHLFNCYDTILCYVSVNDEVDTRCLIEHCLNSKKHVYIPKCVGEKMLFYRLSDINNLIDGEFGIPCVDTTSLNPLECFENTLCIVPGLCFDENGFRIGYGGGYYDRFLADKTISTVGLCFDDCFCNTLPVCEHDIRVNNVLTETGFKIKNTLKQGGYTYE